MQVTIYHNPRCSKSRQALQLLQQDPSLNITIIEYLKQNPDYAALAQLQQTLQLSSPRDMMRSKEAEYKALGLDAEHISDAALIEAIVNTPKLLERPIVITEHGAVIARPPEKVSDVL